MVKANPKNVQHMSVHSLLSSALKMEYMKRENPLYLFLTLNP